MSTELLNFEPSVGSYIIFTVLIIVVLSNLVWIPALASGHSVRSVIDFFEKPVQTAVIGKGPYPHDFTPRRCPVWEHVAQGDLVSACRLIERESKTELFLLTCHIPCHLSYLWDKYDLWYSSTFHVSHPEYFHDERYGISLGEDWQRFSPGDKAKVEDWRIIRTKILDELYKRPGKYVPLHRKKPSDELSPPRFHFYIGREKHYGLPLTRRPTGKAELLWFFMRTANFADSDAARLFSQDPHLRRCLENAHDNELDRILQFVPDHFKHINAKCVFQPKWVGSEQAFAYHDNDLKRTLSELGLTALCTWRNIRFDILREQRQRPCNRKFAEHTARFRQQVQWLSQGERNHRYSHGCIDDPPTIPQRVAAKHKYVPCNPSSPLPSPRERSYAAPGCGSLVSYDGGLTVSYGNTPINATGTDELRQFLLSGGHRHAC